MNQNVVILAAALGALGTIAKDLRSWKASGKPFDPVEFGISAVIAACAFGTAAVVALNPAVQSVLGAGN